MLHVKGFKAFQTFPSQQVWIERRGVVFIFLVMLCLNHIFSNEDCFNFEISKHHANFLASWRKHMDKLKK